MSQSREQKIDYFQVEFHLQSYSYFYTIYLQAMTNWQDRQRVIEFLDTYGWHLDVSQFYIQKKSSLLNSYIRSTEINIRFFLHFH
jgi:hypothetical protein